MDSDDNNVAELSNSMLRSVIGKGLEPKIELTRPSRQQYRTTNHNRMAVKDQSPVLDELRRKVHDQDAEII